MPLTVPDDLPKSFPNPDYLTLTSWKKGVITLLDQSKLPRDALKEANNLFLYEDGQPGPRPGVGWFGAVSPNGQAIDGYDYFDAAGVQHLVMIAGGTIYRSLDNGITWTACTGATLTAGVQVNTNQYNNYLYLTNGTDPITLYNGTTTLVQYVSLVAPAAPTAVKTGLGATTYTYYYKISAVNQVGFSTASASVSIQVDRQRNLWDATSNFVTLTLPALQSSQTRYDIYLSENDLDYYYLSSSLASETSFKDDGTSVVVPSTTAPTGNTTQGPLVKILQNIGSRMYGVQDTANRYRIWFTSGGSPLGSFSNAYDGGYLEFQPGGKFTPVQVADYRDGKGTPLATVFCDSSDGQGCVLQMSLDTLTIGDISITVPSAYKLPGSRGTPAAGSVVNVLNDFMFYNSQAFYNLGSRAQFLNLLSTDESSANIRPTVRTIATTGEANIASVYFDARVFFSVPYGASANNATAIYDTERKAWLPKAFTIGFKKFLRYVDTNDTPRLLALKPGDTQLSEISDAIQGDYGVPFVTSLVTGLYPTMKNRFDFQYTEEAEFEFSNPQGTISVELLGYERTRGFRSTNSAQVTTTVTNVGWDTFDWDTHPWDDVSVVPVTYSESSVKRYFPVQKELNAVQWQLTTNSLDARYILRTLQTWGTPTLGGKPRPWKTTSTSSSSNIITDSSGNPLLT